MIIYPSPPPPVIPPEMLGFTRLSCAADIRALKDNLREDDLRDIQYIAGHDPETALLEGFLRSRHCVTFFRPGDPTDVIGMGGLVFPSIVWLLFHKGYFTRQSDRAFFLSVCPIVRDWLLDQAAGGFMHNMTLKRNRRLRRWLRWLGAVELPMEGDVVPFYFQKQRQQEVGPHV